MKAEKDDSPLLSWLFVWESPVEPYQQNLPEGCTLCVYNHDQLIFSDSGRWLTPLFALERFLATYTGGRDCLSAHDTAAGKAAAVLMARLGIHRAHINLISDLALAYYRQQGITVTYERRIERLQCKTEALLEPMTDANQMYRLLRIRAKLVQGVSVDVQHVSFAYPDKDALLKDVSFHLPEGGRLVIQGDNGQGKTTLLNLLLGNLKPTQGEILIDGMPVDQLPKRTIGYIKQQQTQQQFPVSVREVVSMAVDASLSAERQAWEIDTALRRTGIQHLATRNFFTLSGGERQKTALSRALCQKARLLLLDEPTSFLDAKSRTTLVDILHSLTIDEMPTIIIVTHDKELEIALQWPVLQMGDQRD
ncbi:MAG: DUF1893 domain-containing protein [Sphaerochaeta sp.]|jgi:zinc transport system ATP-binding protein|uniref:DUF1893 domain-containing protein n=1 Tax=Sphaerochaeta sp. TaxID=1972642 RepID=UPI002FCBCD88